MKIIYNRFIPFKGFVAINLFGVLFVRKEYEDDMNEHAEVKNVVINHESIHTAQMKELWFIGFYLMYLFYYLFLLAKTGDAKAAYRKIPFEAEAYANERQADYLATRERFAFKHYKV